MRLIDADAIPYIDLNGDMPQSKIRVYVAFKEKIDKLPTIQERKKGKWIGNYCPYRCDQCGSYSDSKVNFCSYCGADMRE